VIADEVIAIIKKSFFYPEHYLNDIHLLCYNDMYMHLPSISPNNTKRISWLESYHITWK